MNVLVSGSSGLIGRALVSALTAAGERVVRLVRSEPPIGDTEIFWDPVEGMLDPAALEGMDAVVHLAGESIASRWTATQKAKILDSRVKSTRLLSETLAKLAKPPHVLVTSSAIGYYGDRGQEVLTEESAPGRLFLSEVCQKWEAAAEPASGRGIRVVNLRTGFVLAASGGGLPKMVPVFKMGLGGIIGDGRQYMSWIALDDVVGAVLHVLATLALQGPVNAVSPQPVTNREFTKTLGSVLRRPTPLPMPAFAARLLFGEMANDLVLASARILPAKLTASGYQFQFPDLEGALRNLLLAFHAGA